MGTRSRQTSIHDPSPQPVSQERGAGEPVGLHHGPSLRRRRGGGEKNKNKNPAMELSPPPLGISEAVAAPPAVRSLQLQFPARMLRLPPVPRCAVPQGVWSHPPPWRRSQAGLGRCPTGSPPWQPLRNARGRKKKRSLLPSGEGAAATKWCLSGPELQGEMAGAGFRPAGPGGGCWSHGRAAPAGGGWEAGGALGRALRPAPATHPHTHTRALAAAAAAAAAAAVAAGGWRLEAGGGWCIKGEAPPNRVSSPGLSQ